MVPAMLAIRMVRASPRAMTATLVGNARNSQAVSAINGNAATPEGCQTGPSSVATSGWIVTAIDSAQRERQNAGPAEAAVHAGMQSRQVMLPLRQQRQHQPPLRGEGEFAHRIDQAERHVHLAECRRAGGGADQQREQAIAAVLHQSAGGERQADVQQLAQDFPAHHEARPHRTAQQQRDGAAVEMTSCCATNAQAPAPARALTTPTRVPSPCPVSVRHASFR